MTHSSPLSHAPLAPCANCYPGYFAVLWRSSSGTVLLAVDALELLCFTDELERPQVLMAAGEC